MKSYKTLTSEKSRIAGVLLHPTSLPSGQIDYDAFHWIDFLSASGFQAWQVLPLGVPQGNLSPYQCYSAFAINPALLDEVEPHLKKPDDEAEFKRWFEQERYWLEDYALFMVLKEHFQQKAWFQWSAQFRDRDSEALRTFAAENDEALHRIHCNQYHLYTSWKAIRDYASEKDIYLFGDMPIFVAHDSADVWANPQYFRLEKDGMPTVVAGVPPDYFSETGQLWGNPHYDWDELEKQGFDWWLNRLKNHFQLFDIVRIDHFRGLEAVWVVDADSETAIDGVWEKVPGDKFLQTLQNEMSEVDVVAEDLGIITEEVDKLRTDFNLPGMSVLQFSFDAFEDNPHKPKNIDYCRVVYTGTHDNDTTLGWVESLDEETQDYVMDILHVDDPEDVTDAMFCSALATDAQLAIIPMQDLLNLGTEARMNIPGTCDGNWEWKFEWDQIPVTLIDDTRVRIRASGRLKTDSKKTKKAVQETKLEHA